LSQINRVAAGILAFVWAGAGIAGLVIGYVHGRWLVAVPALFALWYAGLWLRVAAQARLLSWSDVVRPWRAR
jgi:hypothetical protein